MKLKMTRHNLSLQSKAPKKGSVKYLMFITLCLCQESIHCKENVQGVAKHTKHNDNLSSITRQPPSQNYAPTVIDLWWLPPWLRNRPNNPSGPPQKAPTHKDSTGLLDANSTGSLEPSLVTGTHLNSLISSMRLEKSLVPSKDLDKKLSPTVRPSNNVKPEKITGSPSKVVKNSFGLGRNVSSSSTPSNDFITSYNNPSPPESSSHDKQQKETTDVPLVFLTTLLTLEKSPAPMNNVSLFLTSDERESLLQVVGEPFSIAETKKIAEALAPGVPTVDLSAIIQPTSKISSVLEVLISPAQLNPSSQTTSAPSVISTAQLTITQKNFPTVDTRQEMIDTLEQMLQSPNVSTEPSVKTPIILPMKGQEKVSGINKDLGRFSSLQKNRTAIPLGPPQKAPTDKDSTGLLDVSSIDSFEPSLVSTATSKFFSSSMKSKKTISLPSKSLNSSVGVGRNFTSSKDMVSSYPSPTEAYSIKPTRSATMQPTSGRVGDVVARYKKRTKVPKRSKIPVKAKSSRSPKLTKGLNISKGPKASKSSTGSNGWQSTKGPSSTGSNDWQLTKGPKSSEAPKSISGRGGDVAARHEKSTKVPKRSKIPVKAKSSKSPKFTKGPKISKGPQASKTSTGSKLTKGPKSSEAPKPLDGRAGDVATRHEKSTKDIVFL